MNKKATIFLLGLMIAMSPIYSQTYMEQFIDLVANKDSLGQQELLAKWEKTDNSDPELYVAYFNYFVMNSKKTIVRLDENTKGKDILQVMDNEDSIKEPVAYMFEETYYDPEFLKKSFDYIDIGIAKHPNRLDMRFGKIYMLGFLEDYERFTIEIIKTVEYSAKNNNN